MIFSLVNGNCEPDSLHRTTKHMFKIYTEAALAQESGEVVIAPGLWRPEQEEVIREAANEVQQMDSRDVLKMLTSLAWSVMALDFRKNQ